MDYKLLGQRIRDWRIQLEFTQEELAMNANISVPYLSVIEHGKKKPSLETIIALANAMGITVDELMIGNQLTTSNDYLYDIDLQLADCSSDEKRLIYELIKALKAILRKNGWIVRKIKL